LIRDWKNEDTNRCIEIMCQGEPYLENDSNSARASLEDPKEEKKVYEKDGEVVGVITFNTEGDRGNFRNIYVDKCHRGKGIGRELAMHMEQIMKGRGCRCILAPSVYNEKFFIKLGYTLVPKTKMTTIYRKKLICE